MAHGRNACGVVSAALLAVSFVAAAAAAPVPDIRLQGVGVDIGSVNGSATDLGNRFALTLDMGTFLKPWLDVSASLGTWSADLTELGANRSGDARAVSVRGIGRVEVSGDAWRLRPHLLAGVGMHRVRVDIPDDDTLERALDGTRLAGEVGIGASYALRERVNARLETSRVMLSDFGHWGVNLGVHWRFRGAPTRAVARTSVIPTNTAYRQTYVPPPARATAASSATGVADAVAVADIRESLDAIGERLATAEIHRRQAERRAEQLRATRSDSAEARAALLALFTAEGVDIELSADRAQFHVSPSALQFAVGATTLSPAGRSFIARVSRVLRTFDRVQVLIEGHTDQSGSWTRNFAIGRARADAVRSAFVDNAVPATRLSVFSLGSGTPAVPATTVAANAMNRRVELRFFLTD